MEVDGFRKMMIVEIYMFRMSDELLRDVAIGKNFPCVWGSDFPTSPRRDFTTANCSLRPIGAETLSTVVG